MQSHATISRHLDGPAREKDEIAVPFFLTLLAALLVVMVGHDVKTVSQMGRATIKNGELLALAAAYALCAGRLTNARNFRTAADVSPRRDAR